MSQGPGLPGIPATDPECIHPTAVWKACGLALSPTTATELHDLE